MGSLRTNFHRFHFEQHYNIIKIPQNAVSNKFEIYSKIIQYGIYTIETDSIVISSIIKMSRINPYFFFIFQIIIDISIQSIANFAFLMQPTKMS